MIESIFQKEMILIKQVHQKNVIFATIGILKILVLSMNHIFVMVVMISYKKLWVLMMLLLFMLKEVLIEFTFGIWAKMGAISIMKNSNLVNKNDVFKFFYCV